MQPGTIPYSVAVAAPCSLVADITVISGLLPGVMPQQAHFLVGIQTGSRSKCVCTQEIHARSCRLGVYTALSCVSPHVLHN